MVSGAGPLGAAAPAGCHPPRPGPAASGHAAGSADAVGGALPVVDAFHKKKGGGMAYGNGFVIIFRCF